jgi:hypothetical protein
VQKLCNAHAGGCKSRIKTTRTFAGCETKHGFQLTGQVSVHTRAQFMQEQIQVVQVLFRSAQEEDSFAGLCHARCQAFDRKLIGYHLDQHMLEATAQPL